MTQESQDYKQFSGIMDSIKYDYNRDYEEYFKIQELRMSFNDSKYQLPNEFIKRFICYNMLGNYIYSDTLFQMFVSANPKQQYTYEQFLEKMLSILDESDYEKYTDKNIQKYRMNSISVDICMTNIDTAVCKNYMLAKNIYEQFESEYNDQLVWDYFEQKRLMNQ